MFEVSNGSYIEFDYVNWKGIAGHRKIKVLRIHYGSTEFHKEEQWLMDAIDLDKNEVRTFATADMSNVKSIY